LRSGISVNGFGNSRSWALTARKKVIRVRVQRDVKI